MPSPYFTSADVDAIWQKDIDPGTASQTAYGALLTTLNRAGAITNTQLPNIATTLAAIQADLAYIKSKLDDLTADPADPGYGHGHPIVAAVEWADAN